MHAKYEYANCSVTQDVLRTVQTSLVYNIDLHFKVMINTSLRIGRYYMHSSCKEANSCVPGDMLEYV